TPLSGVSVTLNPVMTGTILVRSVYSNTITLATPVAVSAGTRLVFVLSATSTGGLALAATGAVSGGITII
ncbi:MAG: exosporium glycoprotein BclB-related protein, partial [Bacilli bacterium]